MVFSSADRSLYFRAPYYLSFAAAVTGVVSIAASHTLIGLAFAALLITNRRAIRLPRIWIPLAVFGVWTLLSVAFSEAPLAGLPQVKKFYVWLLIPLICSTFRTVGEVRNLFLAITGAGTLSAAWSMVQFYRKWSRAEELNLPFYQAYVADRITGFMSHWMTFSGEIMVCLLLLAAFAFFSPSRLRPIPVLVSAALLSAGLLLAMTRSVWPAAAVGFVYLVWFWRRWVILVLPLIGVLIFFLAPEPLAIRIRSAYKPDAKLDSNEHRRVLRGTGVNMIAAHPWFGLGPMRVGRHVPEYLPAGAPRPIPNTWYYDHLHNTYLHYGAERGAPAAIAIIAMFAIVLIDFWIGLRRATGEQRFIFHAVIACTIGIIISGWWEVNIGDSEVLGLFLSIVSAGYAALSDNSSRGVQNA